jgi:outer membrane protein assembly factor BamB
MGPPSQGSGFATGTVHLGHNDGVVKIVTLAVALLAALVGPASSAQALPIPSDHPASSVKTFTGKPATPRPLKAPSIPRHPFMAPNGRSNIHDDAYQSDAYDSAGPLGRNVSVSSALFVAECASVTIDKHGRLITVCVSPTGATLRMLDPTTLATIASYRLPGRKDLGSFSFSNFSGGGYFYLDNHDRAVVSTFTSHLLVLDEQDGKFAKVRDVDLSAATGGSAIQSALPDWGGRIWFITASGVVGFVTEDGDIRSHQLGTGETIANSFAIDESGGVFVVSTHALYRFDARKGKVATTWRKSYDRGSRQKPGQVSQGSGTTPTLIGRASDKGGGYVAITDNADPRMQVVVYRRGKAGPGKPICRQPVFGKDSGSDENSLISVPGGLIAENNYGYDGPLPGKHGLRSADTEPGLVRIDVDYAKGRCHVAWRNDTARVPTVVSKVSLASGLLYGYTHPTVAEIPWAREPLPDLLAPEAWFFTAFDARTGKQVWSRYTGSGLGYNNNYAPVTLGRDGVAYVGTVGGLVRIADN